MRQEGNEEKKISKESQLKRFKNAFALFNELYGLYKYHILNTELDTVKTWIKEVKEYTEFLEISQNIENLLSKLKPAKGLKQNIDDDNLTQFKNNANAILRLLKNDYEVYKDLIKSDCFIKLNNFIKYNFESGEFKAREFLFAQYYIVEQWKSAQNERLFKEEYLKELESFKEKFLKEFSEKGMLNHLTEDMPEIITDLLLLPAFLHIAVPRFFGLDKIFDSTLLPNFFNSFRAENFKIYFNNLFDGFKKFYIKEEAERFFEKRELADLRQKNQELQNQVASKTEVDLSERFKPISRKARMEDIYYTKLKWKWIYAWLSIATVISLALPLPIANPIEILVWLLIRLPFVIVFWVGLAFISKRQREAHNEYIYFTHLFHLLNGMISVSVRSSDEAVRQEFIRAGMSHLASSPLEGLYGKSDKSLEKALSKINLNINKNL